MESQLFAKSTCLNCAAYRLCYLLLAIFLGAPQLASDMENFAYTVTKAVGGVAVTATALVVYAVGGLGGGRESAFPIHGNWCGPNYPPEPVVDRLQMVLTSGKYGTANSGYLASTFWTRRTRR